MPASLLIEDSRGRRHLAVARFDRVQVEGRLQRVHSATASGLLHARHDLPSTEYETLVRLTRRLTLDERECEQMLRRAAFNVMAHNRDDHTKNHGFVLDGDGCWTLAPAYDLTFSWGAGGEHATAVNGKGRDITHADLLELGRRAGLKTETGACQLALDCVAEALLGWGDIADGAGVPADLAAQVSQHHLR